MEIAHTGILRLVAKAVLLGLFVILLAKAILTLLALAAVALVAYFCARAVYTRRAYLARTLLWTAEMLIRSVTVVFQAGTAILVAAVRWLFVRAAWVLCKIAGALAQIVVRGCVGLIRVGGAAWVKIRRRSSVICGTPGAVFQAGTAILVAGVRWLFVCAAWVLFKIAGALAQILVRGCVSLIRVGGAAWVDIRRRSSVICGTVAEAASGAIVGAMLLNLKSIEGLLFLPEADLPGARVCVAALFGAFLGITVGLSRISWAKESETDPFPRESELTHVR